MSEGTGKRTSIISLLLGGRGVEDENDVGVDDVSTALLPLPLLLLLLLLLPFSSLICLRADGWILAVSVDLERRLSRL